MAANLRGRPDVISAFREVEQADLQGNILCGYGKRLPRACFTFLGIEDGEGARRLLGELHPLITPALPWARGTGDPTVTLNLALSFQGLVALGVPQRFLGSFPAEYREGMAARAEVLRDDRDTPPAEWDEGLRPGRPHALVTMYARDGHALAQAKRRLAGIIDRSGGVRIVHEQDAALIETGDGYTHEHFGFADGLAQPSIQGRAGPEERPGQGTPVAGSGWEPLAPGEFVLGYSDEDGVWPDAPREPLGRNGSFLVARKLRQHVALFNRFLDARAGGDPDRRRWLAAKIVGRWPDGTPLEPRPDGPDADLAADTKRVNDFRYRTDPEGLRCPLGSHIRRANPRDALGWEGERTRRHRIIRRAMPYGPPLPEPELEGDREDRGLMFLCYQASIARQFEVVQGSWLADGDAFGLGDQQDFLLGCHDEAARMTIQGKPPTFLSGPPRFVSLRGGEYFFAPGLRAVEALAEGL
jgi:Dyp-type peroxidase family